MLRLVAVVEPGLRVWAVLTRPLLALMLVAVIAVVLAAPVARAQTALTPSSGGPRAAFEITFAALAVGLDLQLTAPGGCGALDDLHVSIRRAQSGHFRFGPRVPRARAHGGRAGACTAGVVGRTASRS